MTEELSLLTSTRAWLRVTCLKLNTAVRSLCFRRNPSKYTTMPHPPPAESHLLPFPKYERISRRPGCTNGGAPSLLPRKKIASSYLCWGVCVWHQQAQGAGVVGSVGITDDRRLRKKSAKSIDHLRGARSLVLRWYIWVPIRFQHGGMMPMVIPNSSNGAAIP